MSSQQHTDIVSKIPSSFEKARSSGDLLFFESTIQNHLESSVNFEIRLCPALQQKPSLPTPHFDDGHVSDPNTTQAKSDPFAQPYNPNLFVGDLRGEEEDEEYSVLLNKYSVVPQHFLLVTKAFQSQSSPLFPGDLVQTYRLLVAARRAGKHFFAFYNCGDNSGASQPHKHLQFIPSEEEDGPPIERVARSVELKTPEKPFSLTALPYANHVFRFPAHLSSSTPSQLEQTLSNAFFSLLDLVISTIRHDEEYPPGKPSYNVIITLEHMHLIPRKKEAYVLETTGEELSVNSLGYAGMLLVKSDREMEAVKSEGVGKILRGVGLESVHDLQIAGNSEDV